MDDQNNIQQTTQTLIQQLIKVVTGFGETLVALKDTVISLKDVVLKEEQQYEHSTTTNQLHHETFLKNLHERHENLIRETRERYEELARQNRAEDEMQKKRIRRDAYIVTFISVFAICGSIIATCYWDYQGKKMDLKRVETTDRFNQENILQGKIIYLQKEIEHRFALRDQLMDAMVRMRAIRDAGQIQCKDDRYGGNDPEAHKQKLFTSEYELEGAYYKTVGFFSDDIQKEMHHFAEISGEEKGGIYSKTAVTKEQLRALQANIDNMIIASITPLQQQRNQLISKLDLALEKSDWQHKSHSIE